MLRMMIELERRDGVDIVKFSINRINALVSEEIKGSITKILDKSNIRLIIDLGSVEYIDSSGFGCLLSLMRTARDNYSQMKIVCSQQSVMTLFETLHLQTIFEIFSDLDDCISSFK